MRLTLRHDGRAANLRLSGAASTVRPGWGSALHRVDDRLVADAKPCASAAQLNFYTARMASLGGGSTLLGYSYNPWDVVDFPTYDGVYVNDRTMPGGSAVSSSYTFNLGIVGVHEVGACELARDMIRASPNSRGAGLINHRQRLDVATSAVQEICCRRFGGVAC